MTDILPFQSREALSARANLDHFIRQARDKLTTFGADLPFDSNTWDISEHIILPGSPSATCKLHFCQWKQNRSRPSEPMREPFCPFAKALIRYEFSIQPVRRLDTSVMALRVLESALATHSDNSDPTLATPDIFNRAAQSAAAAYAPGTAYHIGSHLQKISSFLVKHNMVTVPTPWKSSLPRPTSYAIRTGKQFERQRQSKLPSNDILDAVAAIY